MASKKSSWSLRIHWETSYALNGRTGRPHRSLALFRIEHGDLLGIIGTIAAELSRGSISALESFRNVNDEWLREVGGAPYLLLMLHLILPELCWRSFRNLWSAETVEHTSWLNRGDILSHRHMDRMLNSVPVLNELSINKYVKKIFKRAKAKFKSTLPLVNIAKEKTKLDKTTYIMLHGMSYRWNTLNLSSG